MKNITYIVAFALCISALQAQTIERAVIGAVGETVSNSAITLDQTVGDLAVTDISNGTVTLNQGFHQGVEINLRVSPKLFLEGPSVVNGATTTLSDDLRVANVIPVISPYDVETEANPSVFAVTGDNAIVDWVLVSLRDKNDRNIIIEEVSAFVQADGDVVAKNGRSAVAFDADDDDYFVSVLHRNHLAILTAAPVTIDRQISILDLTSDPLAVFGGENALSNLGNGTFAMVAGDASPNGQIQNSDVTMTLPLVGGSGYSNADADLNGQIQNVDINLFILPNVGRGVQF